jgi:hypothetical protein
MKKLFFLLFLGCAFLGLHCTNGGGPNPPAGKKKPGEPCVMTSEGASACSSNVCIKATCKDGKDVTICAGADCSGTGTCSTPTDQCVAIKGTQSAYCLPTSACQGSNNNGKVTPSGIGKTCEGSQDCPANLVCDSETGKLMCTKTCTSAAECDGGKCVKGIGSMWCVP